LCIDLEIDKKALILKLEDIDYKYDLTQNQFI